MEDWAGEKPLSTSNFGLELANPLHNGVGDILVTGAIGRLRLDPLGWNRLAVRDRETLLSPEAVFQLVGAVDIGRDDRASGPGGNYAYSRFR